MIEETNLAIDHTFKPFVCHTCHMEITEPAMHGWVRTDFGPHTNWKTRIEPCPTCTDSARNARITEKIDHLLGQSRVPLRMAEWSFNTLPHDIDGTAKTRAVFFANAQTPKQALYLYGNPGQGKTGLAISIIQAVMRRGDDAIFIRSLELMDRLRESIHKGTTEGDELLHLAKTVKWLALDDLATEKPTAYVIQELKAIVEARMDAGLFTIFTGNFSLRELEEYWRPDDVKPGGFHPGRRVIERIAEYSEGVAVRGRNLRLVETRPSRKPD
jgi:DNA replication protein DnaC